MVIETIFWRQPLRKGMQRCVLYTCMSTNQKHERQGVAIESAETYLITVLTFSRNSSASGWKLFASVFHSLQVRSARWDPLVSKYLWSRGADIAATCSGVKPSSAPLQCPNMKRDNRTEIKTKRNEGEKQKTKLPNSVHLQLRFSNSYDPVKSGHLNNPVPNTIQSPRHSPQLMF